MPHGAPSEKVTHRYHLIRVIVTLSVIGVVTLLLGFVAHFDPEVPHPVRYALACFVVSFVTGVLVWALNRWQPWSTDQLEVAMGIGLVATYANTIYGGLLGGDPWWMVCGYCVVILIAAGVSLRRWRSFAGFVALAIAAWIVVIENQGLSADYVFNTYVLIGLGTATAAAILLMFKFERLRITSLNRELAESANRDYLTGILNRNGLLSAAESAFTESPEGEPVETVEPELWCAYVDIDYFKSINDRFGHDHGDAVLRRVARALVESGEPGSLSARWGGDEFVQVGVGPGPDEVELEAAINHLVSGGDGNATVSVGVARQRETGAASISELLKAADHRMYDRRSAARRRASATTG